MDWRRHYTAHVGHTFWGSAQVATRHLRVQRMSRGDGIGWDVLQRIKDEMLGPDVLAIEVYPPADAVVNAANIRHLWEVPADLAARIPSLDW